MTEHPGLVAVCVVGNSDAGKTTLVEHLVPELAEYGPVGTIKSIHHDIDVDTPGTDTDRHRRAGATSVIGITPGATFEVTPGGKRNPGTEPDQESPYTPGWLFESPTLEGRALENAIARYHRRGYRFVLIEGYRDAPLPTIRVGDDDRPVGGRVVGTGEEGLETLVETIRTLEPI